MSQIKTREDFDAFVKRFWEGQQPPAAFGLGIQRLSPSGKPLDTWFPHVNVGENRGSAAVFAHHAGYEPRQGSKVCELTPAEASFAHLDFEPFLEEAEADRASHPNIQALKAAMKLAKRDPRHTRLAVVFLESLEDKPIDAADMYFRLHLTSTRKTGPNTVNKDGFGLLPNLYWTSLGPAYEEDMPSLRLRARLEGRQLTVFSRDRIPPMLWYVDVPGVRIGNAQNFRLGFHPAESSTYMHHAFGNFDGGTLGEAMIEGRISNQVIVGAYTDVGGGVSFLGTLSGGNDIIVATGEGCLLEANCGLGFPIGDRVRVEAGHYVKASNWFRVAGRDFQKALAEWGDNKVVNRDTLKKLIELPPGTRDGDGWHHPDGTLWVKGTQLFGISDAIFRRNDFDGASEVIPRGNRTWDGLNKMLHQND